MKQIIIKEGVANTINENFTVRVPATEGSSAQELTTVQEVQDAGISVDGVLMEDGARVFGGWTYNGNGTFSEPAPLPPTIEDVRAEAQRRLILMFGARDSEHLSIIISNAQSEAIALLNIGQENWDADQQQRAVGLEAANEAKENIRAKSNLLEAMDPVPQDYKDDSYWT